MPRRRRHEEHANHEAWAIPYADLMTLLLAFFVVMYAISSLNEGKYRVLADSLSEAFGGPPRVVQPVQVGEIAPRGADPGAGPISPPIALATLGIPRRPEPAALDRDEIAAAEHAQRLKEAMQQERLGALANELRSSLSGMIESGEISVRENALFLEVEMRTDILFGSGSAGLQSPADGVVRRIAETLAPFPNPIKVEGHTDDQPIASALFPSNWELSAARAASVVKLFVAGGVAPTRVAVVGYGAERPKAGNDTPEGRNQNRRVVLVILAEPDPDEVDDLQPPAPAPGGAALAGRGTDPAAADAGGRP
jgi:chemotaxis protein MotB